VNTRTDFEDMLYGHAKGKLVTEPMGMMLGTLVTFDPQRATLDGPFGRHLDVLVKHLLREHPLVQTYKLMSTTLEDIAVILPPTAVQQLMAAARRRDPRGAVTEHEARVSGDSGDDDAGDGGCDDVIVPPPAAPAPRGHSVSSVMPDNARSYGVTPGPDKGSNIGRLILRGSGETQRLESGGRINAELALHPYMFPDGDGSSAMLGSKSSTGVAAYCSTVSDQLFSPASFDMPYFLHLSHIKQAHRGKQRLRCPPGSPATKNAGRENPGEPEAYRYALRCVVQPSIQLSPAWHKDILRELSEASRMWGTGRHKFVTYTINNACEDCCAEMDSLVTS